jgi:hypothetical protein
MLPSSGYSSLQTTAELSQTTAGYHKLRAMTNHDLLDELHARQELALGEHTVGLTPALGC